MTIDRTHCIDTSVYVSVSTYLLEKIIEEFSYEGLFKPIQGGKDGLDYDLTISQSLCYRFKAVKHIFGNLHVIRGSVERIHNNAPEQAVDAVQLVVDTLSLTGINSHTAAHFIKEINNTLFADGAMAKKRPIDVSKLIHLPYAEIEGHMTGHPWFVMNKGRIGFSAEDYSQYAPEMQQRIKLPWIAIHRDIARVQSISSSSWLNKTDLILSPSEQSRFNAILADSGLQTDAYLFMPLHTWQWQHVIQQQFLCDIASGQLVFLGEGDDEYLPMQSIRTFANVSNPEKPSIKLPLSIFNTAVYRGLPKDQTLAAPLLTEWITNMASKDSFLSLDCRFILLGEGESLYVRHPHQSSIEGAPYQFTEQLGAILRDSIHDFLRPDEKAITMAALTYVDQQGDSLIGELIRQSGLDITQWLMQFFEKTVPPLLHCLFQYGLVFSPHGENSILLLKDHQPAGLAMKDFVDDINIAENTLSELFDLSDAVKSAIPQVDDDYLLQFIQTGLFVVHYRYVARVLAKSLHFPELEFFKLLDQTIAGYQKAHPGLQDRFDRFNLYKPSFQKLCLNRLRVIEVGYADASERPKVLPTETVFNPLYIARRHNQGVHCFHYGRIQFRPVSLNKDIVQLHQWMNAPHVAKYWFLNKPQSTLEKHFSLALSNPWQTLYIVSVDDNYVGYAEVYDAMHDRLKNYYSVKTGDIGWHLLIGDDTNINKGLSQPIVTALTALAFRIHAAQRVIFEPDVRVKPFQRIAPRLGYSHEGTFHLPEKTAHFYSCSEDAFNQAIRNSCDAEKDANERQGYALEG